MATLQELRNERLRKLDELKQLGINPYPAKAHRTHNTAKIISDFSQLEGKEVTVAGRIISIRKFGKLAFIVVQDETNKIQLFLKDGQIKATDRNKSQLDLSDIRLLDAGDFVEATGSVIKTQTGEISVAPSQLILLSKSLRPMPTKQDGFTNKEERLRRRYIDININEDVKQRYIRRGKFWNNTRHFLQDNGFIEINIPVLEQTTGGADANPFTTHMDALDQDFYLRISHELPLKRLIGAGYEKVFDIGPRFRNENYSDEHLPEHIAMEWYWAYADWQDGMEFTEKLIRFVADKTWGSRTFKLLNGQHVDLGPDNERWPKISFVDQIKERYGIDVFNCSLDEVKAQLEKHQIEVEKKKTKLVESTSYGKRSGLKLLAPPF